MAGTTKIANIVDDPDEEPSLKHVQSIDTMKQNSELLERVQRLEQEREKLQSELKLALHRIRCKDEELRLLQQRVITCDRCGANIRMTRPVGPVIQQRSFTQTRSAGDGVAPRQLSRRKLRRIEPELIIKYSSESPVSSVHTNTESHGSEKGDTFHEYLKLFSYSAQVPWKPNVVTSSTYSASTGDESPVPTKSVLPPGGGDEPRKASDSVQLTPSSAELPAMTSETESRTVSAADEVPVRTQSAEPSVLKTADTTVDEPPVQGIAAKSTMIPVSAEDTAKSTSSVIKPSAITTSTEAPPMHSIVSPAIVQPEQTVVSCTPADQGVLPTSKKDVVYTPDVASDAPTEERDKSRLQHIITALELRTSGNVGSVDVADQKVSPSTKSKCERTPGQVSRASFHSKHEIQRKNISPAKSTSEEADMTPSNCEMHITAKSEIELNGLPNERKSRRTLENTSSEKKNKTRNHKRHTSSQKSQSKGSETYFDPQKGVWMEVKADSSSHPRSHSSRKGKPHHTTLKEGKPSHHHHKRDRSDSLHRRRHHHHHHHHHSSSTDSHQKTVTASHPLLEGKRKAEVRLESSQPPNVNDKTAEKDRRSQSSSTKSDHDNKSASSKETSAERRHKKSDPAAHSGNRGNVDDSKSLPVKHRGSKHKKDISSDNKGAKIVASSNNSPLSEAKNAFKKFRECRKSKDQEKDDLGQKSEEAKENITCKTNVDSLNSNKKEDNEGKEGKSASTEYKVSKCRQQHQNCSDKEKCILREDISVVQKAKERATEGTTEKNNNVNPVNGAKVQKPERNQREHDVNKIRRDRNSVKRGNTVGVVDASLQGKTSELSTQQNIQEPSTPSGDKEASLTKQNRNSKMESEMSRVGREDTVSGKHVQDSSRKDVVSEHGLPLTGIDKNVSDSDTFSTDEKNVEMEEASKADSKKKRRLSLAEYKVSRKRTPSSTELQPAEDDIKGASGNKEIYSLSQKPPKVSIDPSQSVIIQSGSVKASSKLSNFVIPKVSKKSTQVSVDLNQSAVDRHGSVKASLELSKKSSQVRVDPSLSVADQHRSDHANANRGGFVMPKILRDLMKVSVTPSLSAVNQHGSCQANPNKSTFVIPKISKQPTPVSNLSASGKNEQACRQGINSASTVIPRDPRISRGIYSQRSTPSLKSDPRIQKSASDGYVNREQYNSETADQQIVSAVSLPDILHNLVASIKNVPPTMSKLPAEQAVLKSAEVGEQGVSATCSLSQNSGMHHSVDIGNILPHNRHTGEQNVSATSKQRENPHMQHSDDISKFSSHVCQVNDVPNTITDQEMGPICDTGNVGHISKDGVSKLPPPSAYESSPTESVAHPGAARKRTTYPVGKPSRVLSLTSDTERLLAYVSTAKKHLNAQYVDHKRFLKAEQKRRGAVSAKKLSDPVEEALYGSKFVKSKVSLPSREPPDTPGPKTLSNEEMERLWSQGVDVTNPEVIAEYLRMQAINTQGSQDKHSNTMQGMPDSKTQERETHPTSVSDHAIHADDTPLTNSSSGRNTLPQSSTSPVPIQKDITKEEPSIESQPLAEELRREPATEPYKDDESRTAGSVSKDEEAKMETIVAEKNRPDLELADAEDSMEIDEKREERFAGPASIDDTEKGNVTIISSSEKMPHIKKLELELFGEDSVDVSMHSFDVTFRSNSAEQSQEHTENNIAPAQVVANAERSSLPEIENDVAEEGVNCDIVLPEELSLAGDVEKEPQAQSERPVTSRNGGSDLETDTKPVSDNTDAEREISADENVKEAPSQDELNSAMKHQLDDVKSNQSISESNRDEHGHDDNLCPAADEVTYAVDKQETPSLELGRIGAVQTDSKPTTASKTNSVRTSSTESHDDDSELDVGDSEFAIDPGQVSTVVEASAEGDSNDENCDYDCSEESENTDLTLGEEGKTGDDSDESVQYFKTVQAERPCGTEFIKQEGELQTVSAADCKGMNKTANNEKTDIVEENGTKKVEPDREEVREEAVQSVENPSMVDTVNGAGVISQQEANSEEEGETLLEAEMVVVDKWYMDQDDDLSDSDDDSSGVCAGDEMSEDLTGADPDDDQEPDDDEAAASMATTAANVSKSGSELSQVFPANDTCSLASESGGSSLHCRSNTEDELEDEEEEENDDDDDDEVEGQDLDDSAERTLCEQHSPQEDSSGERTPTQQLEVEATLLGSPGDVLELHPICDASLFDNDSQLSGDIRITPKRVPPSRRCTSTPHASSSSRTPTQLRRTPRKAHTEKPRSKKVLALGDRTLENQNSPTKQTRKSSKLSQEPDTPPDIEEGELLSDSQENPPRRSERQRLAASRPSSARIQPRAKRRLSPLSDRAPKRHISPPSDRDPKWRPSPPSGRDPKRRRLDPDRWTAAAERDTHSHPVGARSSRHRRRERPENLDRARRHHSPYRYSRRTPDRSSKSVVPDQRSGRSHFSQRSSRSVEEVRGENRHTRRHRIER